VPAVCRGNRRHVHDERRETGHWSGGADALRCRRIGRISDDRFQTTATMWQRRYRNALRGRRRRRLCMMMRGLPVKMMVRDGPRWLDRLSRGTYGDADIARKRHSDHNESEREREEASNHLIEYISTSSLRNDLRRRAG
jgi:hypothetical protein